MNPDTEIIIYIYFHNRVINLIFLPTTNVSVFQTLITNYIIVTSVTVSFLLNFYFAATCLGRSI